MTEHDQSVVDYRDPEWVADKLGLDKQTVYKYLQDGTLPGLQLGRKWLISERALVRHLDEEQRRQTAARRAGTVSEGFMTALQDDGRMIGVAAEAAAHRRYHNYIGQEHFLLAIAESPQSRAARALLALGVDAKKLQASVDLTVGPGDPAKTQTDAEIGLTPRAAKAMQHAGTLAAEEGTSINSGHILVGIMREGTGVGAGTLHHLGVEPSAAAVALASLGGEPEERGTS
jgi:excisionase family DNA binding protein